MDRDQILKSCIDAIEASGIPVEKIAVESEPIADLATRQARAGRDSDKIEISPIYTKPEILIFRFNYYPLRQELDAVAASLKTLGIKLGNVPTLILLPGCYLEHSADPRDWKHQDGVAYSLIEQQETTANPIFLPPSLNADEMERIKNAH